MKINLSIIVIATALLMSSCGQTTDNKKTESKGAEKELSTFDVNNFHAIHLKRTLHIEKPKNFDLE